MPINETGEMSASELEPGGDWYKTAVTLRAAAKELAELAGGLYSLEVKPFDQYQGPYAPIHLGGHTARLWVVGDPGMGGIEEFVLSGIGEAIEGDIYTIAEVVKERIEGLPTTEAPTPEQFESVVDGLLKGTPQGLQRMGKQALRDPRRCRKPNGH